MGWSGHAPMLAAHVTLIIIFLCIVQLATPWVWRHARKIASVDAGALVLGGLAAVGVLAWEAGYYGAARILKELGTGIILWSEPWTWLSSAARAVAILAALLFLSGLRRLLLDTDCDRERSKFSLSVLSAAVFWGAVTWVLW